MAASEAAKAHTAETSDRKQEEATASADSVEPGALNDLLPGRQSCGISSAVAPVTYAECIVKSAKCPDQTGPFSFYTLHSQLFI